MFSKKNHNDLCYFSHYVPFFYYCGLEFYVQINVDRANMYQRGTKLIKLSFGIWESMSHFRIQGHVSSW